MLKQKVHIKKWAASWQNQQSGCAPSEDADQPGHPPSLIGVFAVRMKKAWLLSYTLRTQRRLWSDWADAQADLSLPWVHNHLLVLSWGGSNLNIGCVCEIDYSQRSFLFSCSCLITVKSDKLRQIAVIFLICWTMWFYHRAMCPCRLNGKQCIP